MKLKKQKGITLIALVVTIIILLILAGVALASVTGDNGLFRKAKEAINTYKDAEREEEEILGTVERELDKIVSGYGKRIKGENISEIKSEITGEESDPTEVTIDGMKVAIPAGFTIAETSGEAVPDGIVVKDKNNNEWVWIPCYVENGVNSNIDGNETAGRKRIWKYDRYAFTDVDSAWRFRQTKLDERASDGSYKIVNEETKDSNYFHEGLSEASEEYKSIKKYGGYYIGRYEAGKGSNNEVILQSNKEVYTNKTIEESKILIEEMTSEGGSNNKLDRRKVITKMCSSYAWDTALKFIENIHPTYGSTSKDKDGNLANQYNDNKYGTGKLNTGLTTAVCSIYDMGGNAYEYNTESIFGSTTSYTCRGGSCKGDASVTPAGYRTGTKGTANSSDSFRPTLYIK